MEPLRARIVTSLLVALLLGGASLVLKSNAAGTSAQTPAAEDDSLNTFEERRKALESLQLTLPALLNGDPIAAARALNRIGRLQLKLNAPQDSANSFNQALELLKNQSANDVEVDALNGLAAAYFVLKNKDQIEPLLHRSLLLAETSAYHYGKAQALLTLSEFQNLDDHALGLQTAQQSLAVWETVADPRGIAGAQGQIGRCLMAQNRLPEATEKYELAVQLWRDLNDRGEEAGALIMLGFIEARKAEWRTAIDYYTQAQGLIDEHAEPRRMGQIAAGLGAAFNENGLPETGLEHYQRALDYYKLTGDPRSVRSATRGIGMTYYLLKNYAEASIRFQEILRDIPPDSLDATDSYEYLGRISLDTGDRPTALELFQKALPILIKADNPREAARVRALIGQVYELQGDYKSARDYYHQALATFERLTDRLNEAIVSYALGRLELNAENVVAAESYLKRSIQITESIRRVPTSKDLTAAFSARVHERYQAYVECLMRLNKEKPREGFAAKAFETNEMALARSLVEVLQMTQTTVATGLDPQLSKEEMSLKQAIRLKEENKIALLSGTYQKEQLEAVNAELSSLDAKYKSVLEIIKTRNPSYHAIVQPVPPSMTEIQQVLGDDQTLLLEYALGDKRSYLWAVSRNEFAGYELPSRAVIEQLVSRFQKMLTAPQPVAGESFEQRQARIAEADKQLPLEAAALADLVLGPVINNLGKKRLLIVPDGPLQYIPFQALMVPSQSTSGAASAELRVPLILDHDIVNEPSASTLALVKNERASRSQPTRSVAIFANPVFEMNDVRVHANSPGAPEAMVATQTAELRQTFRDIGSGDGSHIPSLPASREEADAIVSIAPWFSSFKAVDFEASRATVLNTNLGQFGVVHFATHGFVNYEYPQRSGLLLSLVDEQGRPQEGFLRMRDIYNMKLPIDLVVLSACNTGLGKEIKGEGLIGLTRGFMYAGASSVTASLWKVEDDATAELMKKFYENMFKNGMSPSVALRFAQIDMWRQKRWHAPYYWAGFVIQGQYDQKIVINRKAEISSTALIASACAVVVLTVFLVWRRRTIFG